MDQSSHKLGHCHGYFQVRKSLMKMFRENFQDGTSTVNGALFKGPEKLGIFVGFKMNDLKEFASRPIVEVLEKGISYMKENFLEIVRSIYIFQLGGPACPFKIDHF